MFLVIAHINLRTHYWLLNEPTRNNVSNTVNETSSEHFVVAELR
jgi:hypothetical protein